MTSMNLLAEIVARALAAQQDSPVCSPLRHQADDTLTLARLLQAVLDHPGHPVTTEVGIRTRAISTVELAYVLAGGPALE